MKLNNAKLYVFIISILTLLFFNTCAVKAESELDKYLTQQAIGTWKFNEGFFNTETTYFADGTFEGKGIINLPDNKLPMFAKGNWEITDGHFIEIIVETDIPKEYLPYNNESIDKIESVSKDRLIRIDEEGEQCVYVRMQTQDDFVDSFYKEENIESYISSIVSLINKANKYIFKSVEEMENLNNPSIVNTNNRITFVYTIQRADELLIHHLSISRATYLPTIFAKSLVSLFSIISGLPIPNEIYTSPNGVYHSVYETKEIVNSEFKFDSIGDITKFFGKAVSMSTKIQIKPIEIKRSF